MTSRGALRPGQSLRPARSAPGHAALRSARGCAVAWLHGESAGPLTARGRIAPQPQSRGHLVEAAQADDGVQNTLVACAAPTEVQMSALSLA